MTLRTPLTVGFLATLLVACTPEMRRSPAAAIDPPAPVCALRVAAGQYRAEVTLPEAARGDYALRLRAEGIRIDQGGPFAAAAGERVVLGQARLPGRMAEAELTVTLDGRSYRCPVTGN